VTDPFSCFRGWELRAEVVGTVAHGPGRPGTKTKRDTTKPPDATGKGRCDPLLEAGESIANSSLWADRNRDSKTAPWHYIDIPLGQSAYDPKRSADDPKHGCVVGRKGGKK
jgi:S1/P1 Nuclease